MSETRHRPAETEWRPLVFRSEADFFAFIERRLRERGFELLETRPAAVRESEEPRHA